MGSQEDTILKKLSKRKWLAPKEDYKTLLKYFGGKAKMKKLLAASRNIPFTRFHRSWSKNNVLSFWKGDTWEQVIDYCTLTGIKPKRIMNWIAGQKINKTDEKTIKIVLLVRSTPSKLSLRSKAIHLKNEIIKIDNKLKKGNNEEDRDWHERIYKRVHNALNRIDFDTDIEDFKGP